MPIIVATDLLFSDGSTSGASGWPVAAGDILCIMRITRKKMNLALPGLKIQCLKGLISGMLMSVEFN